MVQYIVNFISISLPCMFLFCAWCVAEGTLSLWNSFEGKGFKRRKSIQCLNKCHCYGLLALWVGHESLNFLTKRKPPDLVAMEHPITQKRRLEYICKIMKWNSYISRMADRNSSSKLLEYKTKKVKLNYGLRYP